MKDSVMEMNVFETVLYDQGSESWLRKPPAMWS